MSTMQSTVERIAAEEAAKPEPIPDWQPAGPVLTDDQDGSLDNVLTAKDAMPPVAGMENIEIGKSSIPLPRIGQLVVYHLRDGDSRNRRIKFPAIVMDTEPAVGLLKLWVIVDDGDTWMQDHVPAHAAPEPGWEPVEAGEIIPVSSGVIAELHKHCAWIADKVFGENMAPETSLSEEIASLRTRIEALEHPAAFPAPSMTETQSNELTQSTDPVKRGPGRPRKV